MEDGEEQKVGEDGVAGVEENAIVLIRIKNAVKEQLLRNLDISREELTQNLVNDSDDFSPYKPYIGVVYECLKEQ